MLISTYNCVMFFEMEMEISGSQISKEQFEKSASVFKTVSHPVRMAKI